MTAGPLRVAYALKVFPRLSQTFVLDEVLAHEAAGASLALFSMRPPAEEPRHAAVERVRSPVTVLGNSGTWEPTALSERLASALRRTKVSHVHTHFASKPAEVVRRAANLAGIPYSFTAHGRDLFHRGIDEASLARRIRQAAAVVAISRTHLAHLRQRFPALADRFVLVRNGIALDEYPFAPGPRSRGLLAVGRLVPKKGFDRLLLACRLLHDAGEPVRCEIVGEGPERPRLVQMIGALGLAPLVTLTGALTRAEVQGRMREAGALVVPSRIAADGDRDGLPTVLLEAMAIGTPCVATRVAAIPELVISGETGWLVPADEERPLAEACREALAPRTASGALVHRARAAIERGHDRRRNAARLRAVFRTPPGSGGCTA